MKAKDKQRPNYAFHNPYNYALMGGVGAIGILTGNWWMLVMGASLEAVWMMFAPDSAVLKKLAWDPRYQAEQKALAENRFQQILQALSHEREQRVRRLLASKFEISRLSSNNPSFSAELLREELDKVNTLSVLYAEMAFTLERYENYLAAVNIKAIENEIRRLESLVAGPAGDIARKNLEILEKRKEKLREISAYLTKAEAQLNLIESTFSLLADQVVTLQNPQELGSQLDELIDGVEAVRDVSRETERFLTEAA